MSTCLGMYIEKNLIKYAKVEKERDNVKISSFGVKFYENIEDAIDQIVAETDSLKTPISINLSDEMYTYFYMFSLLSKNDLVKSVETEFDAYCYDRGLNANVFETRYALVPSKEDKEKIKVIHVAQDKNAINRQMDEVAGSKVACMAPMPVCLPNVATLNKKESTLFVNLEEKTTVTAVIDQQVYDIAELKVNMLEILEKIKAKENSYAKAYEICKNTTVYTVEGQEAEIALSDYIDDVMPTLYSIVIALQEYIANANMRFDKIYLSGTGVVINNIDLYFQEFFKETKCEILKPFFAGSIVKVNLKDIIEVNSAIALALEGLGYGLKEMNFKKKSTEMNVSDFIKIGGGNSHGRSITAANNGPLDFSEKMLLRTATGLALLIIVYSGFSITIGNQLNSKMLEAKDVDSNVTMQLSAIRNDIKQVESKADRYATLVKNLKDTSNQMVTNASTKDAITTLLNQIIEIIPKDVQITSIKSVDNTKGDGIKIQIEAQAVTYEQLGYFKVKLETSGTFEYGSVYSTPGTDSAGYKKIVIEGVLP